MDYKVTARFDCPECRNSVAVPVQVEPIWHSEGPSKPAIKAIVIQCPRCGEKLGARAWVTPSASSMEFADYPDTHITSAPPSLRDVYGWDDYDVPDDPFAVFNASLTDASELLDEIGRRRYLLNKLVFANFITSFEVFLSDTLINKVLSSELALGRLIERDQELTKMRFSLADVMAAPDLIKNTVKQRLRAVMWHNIEVASALYNKTFGIDILGIIGSDTPTIMKAIEHRHDCVHRNGLDANGSELDVFTQEYLNEIALLLYRVASQIVEEFQKLNAQSHFNPSQQGKF